MQFNVRTRDEDVPEFLSCGHNAHWKIWHSLAKGEPCILCRAEKAELQVHELRKALYAECRGVSCGEECAGGGYRGCSRCDQRAKAAFGTEIPWGDVTEKRNEENNEGDVPSPDGNRPADTQPGVG